MSLTSMSREPTASDENSLKATILNQTSLEQSDIKHFTISSSASRRVLRGQGGRRSLSTYAWSVSFTVVVSLSDTTFTSSESFSGDIESSLTATAFEAAASDALGISELVVASITREVLTRGPSPAPTGSPTGPVLTLAPTARSRPVPGPPSTSTPTGLPTSKPTRGGGQEAQEGTLQFATVIWGAVAALLVTAVVVVTYRKANLKLWSSKSARIGLKIEGSESVPDPGKEGKGGESVDSASGAASGIEVQESGEAGEIMGDDAEEGQIMAGNAEEGASRGEAQGSDLVHVPMEPVDVLLPVSRRLKPLDAPGVRKLEWQAPEGAVREVEKNEEEHRKAGGLFTRQAKTFPSDIDVGGGRLSQAGGLFARQPKTFPSDFGDDKAAGDPQGSEVAPDRMPMAAFKAARAKLGTLTREEHRERSHLKKKAKCGSLTRDEKRRLNQLTELKERQQGAYSAKEQVTDGAADTTVEGETHAVPREERGIVEERKAPSEVPRALDARALVAGDGALRQQEPPTERPPLEALTHAQRAEKGKLKKKAKSAEGLTRGEKRRLRELKDLENLHEAASSAVEEQKADVVVGRGGSEGEEVAQGGGDVEENLSPTEDPPPLETLTQVAGGDAVEEEKASLDIPRAQEQVITERPDEALTYAQRSEKRKLKKKAKSADGLSREEKRRLRELKDLEDRHEAAFQADLNGDTGGSGGAAEQKASSALPSSAQARIETALEVAGGREWVATDLVTISRGGEKESGGRSAKLQSEIDRKKEMKRKAKDNGAITYAENNERKLLKKKAKAGTLTREEKKRLKELRALLEDA